MFFSCIRAFVNNVASFFALGAFLYIVAQIYTATTHRAIIKHTVQCTYCRKFISEKVRIFSASLICLRSFCLLQFVVANGRVLTIRDC